ncbi:MAG: hypothetical protein KAG84_07115 [Bacteroidales bacterium]|nr:hypothetical protein [Bacteroidales bacterium]
MVKKNNSIFLIIFLLLVANNSFGIIDYNDNCKKSFEYTIALHYDKVDALLKEEEAINASNSVISYIRSYSAFLKFATIGSKYSLENFKKQRAISIDKIEDESDDNPYKKYFLADIYLIESIAEAIQKNYLSAIFLFKKAYNTNEENIEAFPDFLPNYKTKGAISITIGSIPKAYTWGLSILGLTGNIAQGFKDITKSLLYTKDNKDSHFLFVENLLIYTFLSDNFAIKNEKNKILIDIYSNEEYNNKYSNNLIYIFSRSSFYQHNKYNDKTIEALEIVKMQNSEVSKRFCYLNYLYGQSLLYKKDITAEVFFRAYINNSPTKNYKAASHQKLAWSRLINGDLTSYLAQIEIIKKYDDVFYDSDKQAKIEAKSGVVPNTYLLRSRLLFDGGYYKEAEEILIEGDKIGNYKSERNKIEYIYRLGRINDESGKYKKAEKYYKQTIAVSKDMKYYYAAKSALQLGYYYESINKIEDAELMYNLVLDLDFDEYQNGITQKAKAGLNRIEN